MTQSRKLKEMSWTLFEEYKKHTNLVIIPVGAIEVYGPHLPLGSDSLLADQLAKLVAERVGAIIGPTVEAGDSNVLNDFPGTITIRPESLKAYLGDIVHSLLTWGFTRILFINGHAGNVPIINQIVHQLRGQHSDVQAAQIDCWRFIKAQDHGISETGKLANGHAGEIGTSVLLHLHPELVHQDKIADEVPDYEDAYPEIVKYGRLSSISKSGVVGSPSFATVEKGELLVQHSVDRIVQFLHDVWDIKPL
ncbi:creatininase family protein [Paenibacillus xylanexedens]|uniref:creatininase family protein n=1 Tax=Paenibacillus xylanexedens TaxID=528191 RepID=UPI0011A006C4|nr:creatininase family protein [Paenibacillus xylanexedens]